MNHKASKPLVHLLTRLDRQRHKRQALLQQVVACLWWMDLRAPSSGGDAA